MIKWNNDWPVRGFFAIMLNVPHLFFFGALQLCSFFLKTTRNVMNFILKFTWFSRRIYSLYIVCIFIKFIPNIRSRYGWDRTILATDELMMKKRLKKQKNSSSTSIHRSNEKKKINKNKIYLDVLYIYLNVYLMYKTSKNHWDQMRAHTKSTKKLSIRCVYNCNINEVNCWFDLITVSSLHHCVSMYTMR